MRARRLVIMLAALALSACGCAVGRFVAGAPSGRTNIPSHALLIRRCGNCHDVPVPESMSRTAWVASLDRMKVRMRLPESEWDLLASMAPRGAQP